MNRKRSQLQAYFAGIFDGEGHVGIRRVVDTKGYVSYVCQVVLQMNDPQAVMLLWREYPDAYLRITPARNGSKAAYYLQFSQHKAYTFLKELLPFLLIKHEQVKVALSFLAHRRRDHQTRRAGSADCERCARATQTLLDIRADAKRVNSVKALLEHEMREYRAKPEDVADDVVAMTRKVEELLEGVETKLRAA